MGVVDGCVIIQFITSLLSVKDICAQVMQDAARVLNLNALIVLEEELNGSRS